MSTTVAAFTPPQICSTSFRDTTAAVSVGVTCSNGTLVTNPNCFPATPTACPVGWEVITTRNSITTCCPSEYPLHTAVRGVCYSEAGGRVLTAVTCDPSQLATFVTATYPFIPGVWAVDITYVGITSASTSSVTSTVSSSSDSSVETAPSTPTSTPTPTRDSTTTPLSKSTLSAGAIAGIVVGAVIAIALILICILLLKKRYKGSQTPAEQGFPELQHPGHYYSKAELHANPRPPAEVAQSSLPYSSTTHVDPVELEDYHTTRQAT